MKKDKPNVALGCTTYSGALCVLILIMGIINKNAPLTILALISVGSWVPLFFLHVPSTEIEVPDRMLERKSMGLLTGRPETVADEKSWQYRLVKALVAVHSVAATLTIIYGLILLGKIILAG